MRPQQLGQQRSSMMGRPLGARDKFPRGTKSTEQIKILETEMGQLRRENADLKAELDKLGGHVRFPGDAVDLIEASAHGDYHPTWLQFRAAVVLYERDFDLRRAGMDAERQAVEQERITYRDAFRLDVSADGQLVPTAPLLTKPVAAGSCKAPAPGG
jgi:hypothetical protein